MRENARTVRTRTGRSTGFGLYRLPLDRTTQALSPSDCLSAGVHPLEWDQVVSGQSALMGITDRRLSQIGQN